ncbi:toprim domain-containing protein [Candidatus Woesearchaeota archaeon]|nr:toprim domain-containing protein [Candidatus Woesearchaeota archaeon]
MVDEEFYRQIDKLREQNLLIIVEGAKDKSALNAFGIANVRTLNKSLFAVVEEIAQKTNECAILTDLDGEGKRLYAKLSQDLQRHGVKINNKFRNFLFRETQLRQIEGLSRVIPLRIFDA